MAAPAPARPGTAEIAGPQAGIGGIGELVLPWLDSDPALGADPRQWQADPTGIAAAQAALRDPHTRAVLDQRLDAVTAAPLDIEPGGPMRRDRQAAGDLADQFGGIGIDRISRELLHAVWYGYSIAECIWEIDGARVRLADLKVRDPARFRWRKDGTPLLVTRENPRGIELPPAKFVVLAQPRSHGGQPHGPGAAQWCLWPVWLKRQAVRMWAVALEKFGSPTAIGIVRRDAQEAEIETMLQAQRAMAGGAGLVIPEGQELRLLDSARRAGGDYGAFVAALDGMIADAVLGQRATSEIGPWRGTAEVQAKVLERLVAADARRLAAALRNSVAAWLTQWNFPGADVPELARNTAPPEDLVARARREETVARTSGLRPTPAHVEQVYGGEWEAAPAAPATPPSGGDPRLARLAEPAQQDDDAIDDAVDAIAADWQPLVEPAVAPVLEAAGNADSLGRFRAALDERQLWEDMNADRIARRLHRTAFSARLSGDAGLDGGEG